MLRCSLLYITMNSETLKQEIRECIEEIHELESSSQSRSHAGPTLALRSLNCKYERLMAEWEKLHPPSEKKK
jgi:hypothetical protein